ncbi:MAG: DsbA family protein [Gammaproteobacteria bacterium]
MAELYYVHDPMCSWCYGFKPTLDALLKALPENIQVKRLLGGLAPDTNQAMPLEMQEMIQSAWQRIEKTIPSIQFNYSFWENCKPRRSTYPACRAIIAARTQGEEYDGQMTFAIQRAYYLEARNPSDDTTLIRLAQNIGLDEARFTVDLNSLETRKILGSEIRNAETLGVYSFPGLALCAGSSCWPIAVDYIDHRTMLNGIRNTLEP